jgi:hypothetical protein
MHLTACKFFVVKKDVYPEVKLIVAVPFSVLIIIIGLNSASKFGESKMKLYG